MPIHFDPVRWEGISSNADKWWRGELGRPLVNMTLHGAPKDRCKPSRPYHEFTAYYGPEVEADRIADVWGYHLSSRRWIADGFPNIWPNFGAGVVAAFLGAKVQLGPEHAPTVWFHPEEVREVKDLHFEYDPENYWLNRVCEVARAVQERMRGQVQVGMTDLGGNLDVLSAFRPGEGLLLDLVDHPEEVKRCIREVHELWFRYFQQINRALQPWNRGYTSWTPIFSPDSYYMLQCDFAYMISPEMFNEFVKPEIEASCKRLKNAFYHLDGVGQLPHLDSLLEIDELAGIQWVPGDGKPPVEEWPDIYKRIIDAGKRTQIWGGPEVLNRLIDQMGEEYAPSFCLIGYEPIERQDEMLLQLERYGISE